MEELEENWMQFLKTDRIPLRLKDKNGAMKEAKVKEEEKRRS